MKFSKICLFLIVVCGLLPPLARADLYVSTTGSDAAPGTKDQPLATLERARDLAREAHKAAGAPQRVILRGGSYFLKQPLVLAPEDSGLTVTALPGETPVLSGGQAVSQWAPATLNGKACWVADLSAAPPRAIRELFIESPSDPARDPSRPRTRLPKEGFYRFSSENELGKGDAWRIQPTSVKFNPGDMKAWDNITDVELFFLQRWYDCHNKLARVDEATHTVYFAPKAAKGIADSNNQPARYCLYNVKEAFDTPGQWYLDRPTNKLYYLPLPGETPGSTTAMIPRLAKLIEIQGAADRKVQGVRFEHIAFRHAETEVFDSGRQGAANIPGGIVLENAQGCSFFGCEFSELGCYAAEVTTGSADTLFVACRFENLGGGGVRANEGSEHTTVADCTFHKGGRLFLSADAVFIQNSARNRVLHNHIWDFYYSAIAAGWTWGYAPTQAWDNIFEDNLIHDLGFGQLDDMGGFYMLGTMAGTIIRNNVIHDVTSYHYGGWGIYTDEGSSGILVENNLVYRANNGGFHQHYGRDNILRNNIFALGANMELRRTRYEHINSFVFEKNIVYLAPQATNLDGKWLDGNYTMGGNIFYRHGGGAVDFSRRTLEQWQREGHDTGSIVADPMFKNVAGDDFTLQEASPALKAGFKPLDLSKVGPRALDPRQVALAQWPLPEEKPRVILEGRLTGMVLDKRRDPRVKGFEQTLALNAATPLEVTFALSNRGPLAAQGAVEFKIEPAAAATIDGAGVVNYDLKPGERTTAKLTLKTTAATAPRCRLVATPKGEGLVPTSLWINSPDRAQGPQKAKAKAQGPQKAKGTRKAAKKQ